MYREQMTTAPDKDALHSWVNDLSAKMKAAQQSAAHYEQLYLLERARNEIWELKEERRKLQSELALTQAELHACQERYQHGL